MNRDDLKEYFRKAYSTLIKEQDDPFATDDAGEEEESEEETEDADAEEAEEETEDDAGEADDAAEDEEGDDTVKAPEIDASDEQRFDRSLDDKLQALLIDIEADSIKSGKVQQESLTLRRLLIVEGEGGVPIDIDKFASEVARLVLNFDAFLDIEGMMLSKVRKFLVDKHGEEVADEVENILTVRHDIKKNDDTKRDTGVSTQEVPIAVGASGTPGA